MLRSASRSAGTPGGVKSHFRRASVAQLAALAGGLLVLSLLACRHVPVENQLDVPFATPGPSTDAEAAEVIWRAGRKLGWEIVPAGDGALEGTLRVRKHAAVVTIRYDTARFSITYLRSQGLQAKPDGTIHENYNVWVRQLAAKIRTEPVHP